MGGTENVREREREKEQREADSAEETNFQNRL